MSKRSDFGLGTGGASILVIFVLLCLTTFATLSIVSANADYKLTQQSAQAVTDYYAADLKASELLAQIDTAAAAAPEQGTVAERIGAAVAGLDGVTVAQAGDGAMLRYSVPISETRELSVALDVSGGGALTCSVAAWQAVSTVEWEENNSIQLWDGGPDALAVAAIPDGLAGLPAEVAE